MHSVGSSMEEERGDVTLVEHVPVLALVHAVLVDWLDDVDWRTPDPMLIVSVKMSLRLP